MSETTEPRKTVLSLKIKRRVRRLMEHLAAQLTLRRDRKHSLTDVLEEAVEALAKRERV